ncbi:acyl-CoA thioesterase [Paracoccus sp. P2]|uniref:Acyl-CoA thioesterase n=1 Tax=Paracoccus pantotrophus TaxID=82367 RepID=A0A1I5MJC6_PARPN|nr:acyl-CoA thioesterase [Paracoccus pantotrophus]MDF3856355.1 acyl-CoA thioesterase [Paracoccus pantotrophus]QFG35889.1 acyl-CoA thioesterase [Paracoccus pantotrophus]QLH12765.1 acyl-CoA thioesterase [Paracoccus pantotrophus]RDD96413.1 acyl-CoA thioesterase [Paracoccus pantotrophus]RKS43849.1 acyl-CoA thioesterase FadM [Paracoccus pantotrophus]
MAANFIWSRRVGFGDCDPARIAYTGKIADFALEALEAFWDDLLDGESWYEMNVDHGYGMPFVKMDYAFSRPITPRAPLLCHVAPTRIGTTSVAMHVRGIQQELPCFEASFISVFVALEKLVKIEIPVHIRAALNRRYPELERMSPCHRT